LPQKFGLDGSQPPNLRFVRPSEILPRPASRIPAAAVILVGLAPIPRGSKGQYRRPAVGRCSTSMIAASSIYRGAGGRAANV
jgi:hypothetical protein